MFHNKPTIIDWIKQESGNDFMDSVQCRIKPEEKYDLYIFTVVMKDQDELIQNWKDISSDIAIHFQGGLKNDIEIWNIYILFLVFNSVNSEVRYLVEQNKYSSRKLVIEDVERPLSETDIDNIINDKLFSITVKSPSIVPPTESISMTLKTKYKSLYTIVNDYDQEKPSVLFNKYLELLKDEL
ncbi:MULTISPECIES: ABC-three component system middle component 1 [Priestia]|uniref:ABC-three component system middle component 1 n=1 Tax=Priestia TaxID=2800373 RepID=UPI001CBFA066|nr:MULTISPECIES: ABC-three component system middle component 1 [Priestia]MED5121611.1 ABC-three component system middle component 1 [Priestia megaterium]